MIDIKCVYVVTCVSGDWLYPKLIDIYHVFLQTQPKLNEGEVYSAGEHDMRAHTHFDIPRRNHALPYMKQISARTLHTEHTLLHIVQTIWLHDDDYQSPLQNQGNLSSSSTELSLMAWRGSKVSWSLLQKSISSRPRVRWHRAKLCVELWLSYEQHLSPDLQAEIISRKYIFSWRMWTQDDCHILIIILFLGNSKNRLKYCTRIVNEHDWGCLLTVCGILIVPLATRESYKSPLKCCSNDTLTKHLSSQPGTRSRSMIRYYTD